MGGASSLLDKNDWDKADGKLISTLDTLDGASPTSAYGIYYIAKRGINQREFDITDAESNLLYTTRQVPGTVCSFDVIGSGMGDYRLRINSDLARRYWTVYRFGSRGFEGQEADKEESEKASKDLEFTDTPIEKPVKLFKRCCVTVSWSRYMAVAAFYGPPTVEMLMEASKLDDEKLNTLGETSQGSDSEFAIAGDDDIFAQASQISRRMRTRASTVGSVDSDFAAQAGSDELSLPRASFESETHDMPAANEDHKKDRSADPSTANAIPRAESRNSLGKIPTSVSRASLTSSKDEETVEPVSVHSESSRSTNTNSGKVREWFQKHTRSIREKSQEVFQSTVAARHPLEGVVDLDKPLLLCQEIYTKLIGNHQTSRASKDHVLKLLRQDTASHKADHPEDGALSTSEDPIIMSKGHLLQASESAPGNGVEESKTEDTQMDEGQENQAEEEQPLVAYWNWEHSFRSQKMKLYLARNSDLAMHIVLAILSNQVRYERNAIAMTV